MRMRILTGPLAVNPYYLALALRPNAICDRSRRGVSRSGRCLEL